MGKGCRHTLLYTYIHLLTRHRLPCHHTCPRPPFPNPLAIVHYAHRIRRRVRLQHDGRGYCTGWITIDHQQTARAGLSCWTRRSSTASSDERVVRGVRIIMLLLTCTDRQDRETHQITPFPISTLPTHHPALCLFSSSDSATKRSAAACQEQSKPFNVQAPCRQQTSDGTWYGCAERDSPRA